MPAIHWREHIERSIGDAHARARTEPSVRVGGGNGSAGRGGAHSVVLRAQAQRAHRHSASTGTTTYQRHNRPQHLELRSAASLRSISSASHPLETAHRTDASDARARTHRTASYIARKESTSAEQHRPSTLFPTDLVEVVAETQQRHQAFNGGKCASFGSRREPGAVCFSKRRARTNEVELQPISFQTQAQRAVARRPCNWLLCHLRPEHFSAVMAQDLNIIAAPSMVSVCRTGPC